MHTIYPKRIPLASFHVRPLSHTLKFILLCCNGANPFKRIAYAAHCTYDELHTSLSYLYEHGYLMPMVPERECVA